MCIDPNGASASHPIPRGRALHRGSYRDFPGPTSPEVDPLMTFTGTGTAVPEGQSRIAQRFNAGKLTAKEHVPKGRLNHPEVSRPFGTRCPPFPGPSVETLGYSHASLRDEHVQLVIVEEPKSGRTGVPGRSPSC